jgi:hypothetical protein
MALTSLNNAQIERTITGLIPMEVDRRFPATDGLKSKPALKVVLPHSQNIGQRQDNPSGLWLTVELNKAAQCSALTLHFIINYGHGSVNSLQINIRFPLLTLPAKRRVSKKTNSC